MVIILSFMVAGCANPLEHQALQMATLRAAVDLGVLKSIRSGDTNAAIAKLEDDLNGARIDMEMFLPDEPHPDPYYVRALEKTRAYQAKHPYGPKVGAAQTNMPPNTALEPTATAP
jgi:outer membrane murein-binding lipoprotein Lpp